MLEPRNRKMRLFARMVESADTEVSKTSALGRVGSSPTLSTSKFSVYKTLNRAFSNNRGLLEDTYRPVTQLGECYPCKVKVARSSRVRSTSPMAVMRLAIGNNGLFL